MTQPGPPLCECVTRIPGSDLVEQRRDRIGDDLDIERSRVRRHRAEVLIERFGVLRELNAREVVRPQADPEHAEPELLIGRGRDRAFDHAAAGVAAAGLIDHVHAKPATQEDRLIALAPVRRGLPCLGELPGTVPQHERQLPRVHGDLVECVGMIAAKGLARGRGRLVRIECAGTLCHRPADREAALFLDDQRCWLRRLVGHCASCCHEPRGEQRCARKSVVCRFH